MTREPQRLVAPQARSTFGQCAARGALDTETRAMLRATVAPDFARAVSWEDLSARLARHGLAVALRGGRLVLLDQGSGGEVCLCAGLGFPLSDLARRFGRARLRLSDAAAGAGEFRQ